ncbi:MAG: type II toxin-antitoxin system VapC family toxin [Myxococcota bacterium]
MRLVLDASVVVEYLLRTETGHRAADRIHPSVCYAPALLDAEVFATLRRLWLHGHLTEARALAALGILPRSRALEDYRSGSSEPGPRK